MHWILPIVLFAGLTAAPRRAHEFHVTYGRMAVEGNVAVARIRFYTDDLETTLARAAGEDSFRMETSPAVDSLFLAYFARQFQFIAAGEVLEGTIIGSGDDVVDREPAWWFLIRFDAGEPIGNFRVRNALLFDVFEDQKNMLKVIHLPDDTQRSYTFSAEEETIDVVF
jgi:hypothetical protein